MADLKITQLTELIAPATGDLLAIVDDPAGSAATKKITIDNLALIYGSNSMARQAIINGNFDVWQRGTTFTLAADTVAYGADRWRDYPIDDGGTPPTMTRSRQLQTSGDLYGSFYFSRLAVDGAGTSLGANSGHRYNQNIEHGTRLLCGDGKKLTISFYARSSIANKKLGIDFYQNYGTGGSPTAQEHINGTNWTLTSSWVKYTYTVTTNTLASKTFGTNNNDYFRFNFAYMWGSTTDADFGADGAETYVGSGNIDIAQVQLCAGDVALPFQPKSYEDELRNCKRYYQQFGGDAYHPIATGQCTTTTNACIEFYFSPWFRGTPARTTSGNLAVTKADGTGQAVTAQTDDRLHAQAATVNLTTAGNLVAGDSTRVFASNAATAYIAYSAEI
jgi:hypothetical protein